MQITKIDIDTFLELSIKYKELRSDIEETQIILNELSSKLNKDIAILNDLRKYEQQCFLEISMRENSTYDEVATEVLKLLTIKRDEMDVSV